MCVSTEKIMLPYESNETQLKSVFQAECYNPVYQTEACNPAIKAECYNPVYQTEACNPAIKAECYNPDIKAEACPFQSMPKEDW